MDSRLNTAEASGTQIERNTAISSRIDRPITMPMNSGSRLEILLEKSSNEAVSAADVDVQVAVARGRGDASSSRSRSTRSPTCLSCGEVVGITDTMAASPACWAGRGDRGHALGASRSRPGAVSSALVSLPPLLAAHREQQRAVGARAEALAELVVGHALVVAGRLVAVVGLARGAVGARGWSGSAAPAADDQRTAGRHVRRRPQFSKARRRRRARVLRLEPLASAPAKIGSTVIEETTTMATAMAEPTPILPISGMPTASRPAMATMTIRPAATTEVPGGGVGPRRGLAARSRPRPTVRGSG